MAGSQDQVNPVDLKMQLKQAAREEKMKRKQQKREEKMRKAEEKRRKKEEKLRAKLAAKGIVLPPKVEAGEKKTTISGKEELPEAEIITAEADVWTPKSARNVYDIQKRIDRMDHKSVKTLKDRYKERFGEDMEVPDVYNVKSSIEVETAEETGELEKPERETKVFGKPAEATGEEEKSKKKFGFLSKKKEKEPEVEKKKVERPLRFFDLRTPFFLRDKLAAEDGKGKRAGLMIIDIILNILLIIFIIKIITTIIYVVKDRRQPTT
jgi:hypothetical protein